MEILPNGNLTITAGTLDIDFGNDNLTIGGNFANSGTLDVKSNHHLQWF